MEQNSALALGDALQTAELIFQSFWEEFMNLTDIIHS